MEILRDRSHFGLIDEPSQQEDRDTCTANCIPSQLNFRAQRSWGLCSQCVFEESCGLASDNSKSQTEWNALGHMSGSYQAGDYIFRAGDTFDCIAIVRAGSVKTLVNDSAGNEHILAFGFPGDILGLGGFHSLAYPCSSIAMEPIQVCKIPYADICGRAQKSAQLQYKLLGALSEQIGRSATMAARSRADERMASFLVDLSMRQRRRGYSPHQLHLKMSRADLANYLRMAPETASRVLKRLIADDVAMVRARHILILDMNRLLKMAAFSR